MGVEEGGGGDDGAGEGAAAGLIDAGNMRNAAPESGVFDSETGEVCCDRA